MATNPNTLAENVGRITAPDANYPYGSAKNDTTGTAGDGTPIKEAILNDTYGLQQALLAASGIVPSGNADTAVLSEYLQAIVEIAAGRATWYDDSGVVNAYVLDLRTGQQGPASYFDGMAVEFTAGVDNTSASTVNVAGLGVKSIVLADGSAVGAGEVAGRVRAIYDSALGKFVLSRAGSVNLVTFAAGGTYTPPDGVKALEFTCTGAGGGGGGVDGQGAGTAASSGGGGAGSTTVKVVTDIATSYAIVVGAGGVGGIAGNNAGAAGSSSTVTASGVSLAGGAGNGAAGATGTAGTGTNHGGSYVLSSGGDFNFGGNHGSTGGVLAGDIASWGDGAAGVYGGGNFSQASADGTDGAAPGAGGSGVAVLDVVTDRAGGDGADGIVIIKEFY